MYTYICIYVYIWVRVHCDDFFYRFLYHSINLLAIHASISFSQYLYQSVCGRNRYRYGSKFIAWSVVQSYEGQWKTRKRSGKSTLHMWLLLLIKNQPGQNHPKSKVSKVRWPSSWEESGSSCFLSQLAPVDAGLRATFGWSSQWDLLRWPLIWSRQIKRGLLSVQHTRASEMLQEIHGGLKSLL